MLEVKEVSVTYGNRVALERTSFVVEKGQWWMIVGPNGAGKSTLLDAITQSVKYSGTVRLDGVDVRELRSRERAKKIGVLRQQHPMQFSYTVEDVVRMGRYAYRHTFRRDVDGYRKIKEALQNTGMQGREKEFVHQLSGGEVQRTYLAQLLAQDPQMLLMDEPSNHLDLQYQRELFESVQHWMQKTGNPVVSVVHDLSYVRRYATNVLLLSKGRVVACGTPKEVLSPERLHQVYGMDVYAWMRELLSQWEPDASISTEKFINTENHE
jgi:iron complex transport system ATP-binding protein